jgi:putative transposase
VDGSFHVWFSTKRRAFILEDEIARDVKGALTEIARRAGIEMIEVEAVGDHVHLLVRLEGKETLSSVMHRLKGASAREVLLRYPELKLATEQDALWQRGYGWRRLEDNEVCGVRMYIRTLRSRPLRRISG